MISRRNFLELSLGAAAAASFGTASATPVRMPDKWDETHDFVILGAGSGGLAAAAYAKDAGLDVVVLEKLGFPGGSSLICGGAWATAGTDEQKAKGIVDSSEKFLEDMLNTGGHQNDPALVKAMIASTRIAYEFVTKKLGVKPDTVDAASGMSVPRAHHFVPAKLIKALHDYDLSKGVPFLMNTAAERLVWDHESGCIAGVRASSKGKTLWIRAKKGVLIATGGFSRNPALLKKYNPLMAAVDPEGGAGNTGDGLLMAQAYGADVLDTQYIKATFGYRPDPKKYGPQTLHGYYDGAIIVNADGKRFVDESISYKLLSDAALQQKDVKTFEFFDEAVRVKMRDATAKYRKLLGPLDNGGEVEYCFRGDTIEDVAQKAGIDPKALRETVERYNKFAEKGADEDFGRTSLTSGYGKLVALKEPPFFLYPARPRLIATYCGLRIDPSARVIDVFGEPIPHLYACGEAVGGVHGAAYMSGSAVGKAIGFGRIAALAVAKS